MTRDTLDPTALEEVQSLIRLLLFAASEAERHELPKCFQSIWAALDVISEEYDDLRDSIENERPPDNSVN